jgi:ferric-dicitrate binding protein FerR (iron transport regulator)
MKPEKQRLIHDLLDDGKRRESTLLAGAQILRRRRRWRMARGGLAAVLALAAVVMWFQPNGSRHTPSQASVPSAEPSAQVRPQSLTDDELLALFPDTPVVLAKLSDGRKRLIFPRPGDEKRFITRL